MEINEIISIIILDSWKFHNGLFHQTSHFLSGFIGEFRGQLYCSANSRELESVPITLKVEQEKKKKM